MTWRLSNSISRIELDNRQPGKVRGLIWLVDRDEPVLLNLVGNALRDVAGAQITITNPCPVAGDDTHLETEQNGVAGDLTASRKVCVFDIPVKEACERRERGLEVPEHLGNSVYVEWFSGENGHVVIEGTKFTTAISAYDWHMSQEEEDEQCRRNIEAINDWRGDLKLKMRAVGIDDEACKRTLGVEENLLEEDLFDEECDDSFKDYRAMNEYEWERHLKESDELTNKFGKLMDKHVDHPDRDRMVASEMGWSWLEEALEDVEEAGFEDAELSGEDIWPLVPKRESEGVDWIRKDNGDVTHPLTDRSFHMAMDMWHHCNDRKLLGEDGDEDLHRMVSQAQTLSSKLAGALNGLAYDTYVEGGFIVACLKRALTYFNEAASAMTKVEQKNLIGEHQLLEFRHNLYDIRQDMLRLMDRFRQEHSE